MNIGVDIRPLMSKIRTGVGEYTYELLNAIFALDKKNHYFLFYNSYGDISENIPKWAQENIRYIAAKWPNKIFNASIKLLHRPHIDKITAKNTPRSLLPAPYLDFFFSPNLNFTALSKKTKFILTIHDLSFEFFPQFYSLKQRLWHKTINPKKQCQQAALILAPSENTKRDIADRYKINEKKIKVIYPGLSSIFNTQYPISDARQKDNHKQIQKKYNLPSHFILFLGTIEPRKNITGLIEAFVKIHSSLPMPYSLIIAGAQGWDYQKIYKYAYSSPLKNQIKFIGYVEPKDKPALYSLAEIFVYPSFYEGFGFPALEAMACGTPVITSNRSSLPEVAGGAAYLVNPNNTAAISQGIFRILTNQKIKEYFKAHGLNQARQFNWTESAKQWLNIILN